MPHIINEGYLYTESGSGFTQGQQTLLCKNVNSNFMHLISRSWDTSLTLKSLKSKLKG